MHQPQARGVDIPGLGGDGAGYGVDIGVLDGPNAECAVMAGQASLMRHKPVDQYLNYAHVLDHSTALGLASRFHTAIHTYTRRAISMLNCNISMPYVAHQGMSSSTR